MTRTVLALLFGLSSVSLALPTTASSQSSLDFEKLTWGRDGHTITGQIAQKFLDPTAVDALNTILSDYDGQLSHIVNWADEVKSTPAYRWSGGLHYINTPDWACNYDHNRDCGDNYCVAGAIANYTTIFNSTKGSEQTIALKFLTHFIGDIHQPLHVGFTSDRGGNSISVKYLGKSMNLHGAWDFGIIDTIVSANFTDDQHYVDHIVSQLNAGAFPGQDSWAKCQDNEFPCPDEWAVETVELACKYAYVNADGATHIKTGDSLGQDYYERVADVVTEQLARSGYRMAAVINSIVGNSQGPFVRRASPQLEQVAPVPSA